MSTVGLAPEDEERSYRLIANALSHGRRDARLVTGPQRSFGLNAARTVVQVPHPAADRSWTPRTMTCGIALQCSPSKERIASVDVAALREREAVALSAVEGRVALGWVMREWPGIGPELERVLCPLDAFDPLDPDLELEEILRRTSDLVRSREAVVSPVLFGRLPRVALGDRSALTSAIRRYGRLPWSSKQNQRQRIHSIPVGGDGGIQNPNLAPPSRPEDEEIEIRADERVGVPYPEWNMWTKQHLADHVAVLEIPTPTQSTLPGAVPPDVRRWFEQHTHRSMRNGLEDGADLDITRYVDYVVDLASGHSTAPRLFRDLAPTARSVSSALLLDASSSLSAHGGRIFDLELACADALSQAMTLAGERHGVFTFTGNTRHRVEVRCLKDFDERRFVRPSRAGLRSGGYTRLGAPIRHLTQRLLGEPAERRLLILIGDGLMCDEGYEGRYAWADVAHAVEEAEEAGLTIYYIGVGTTRVDPLPEVFGSRRSRRITRVEDLPRVLAEVHGELVAA